MAELILTAGDGHVAQLAHESDPVRAIVEMIWNALDAEAWNVSVQIERDDQLGAIVGVHVEDDGHGISRDEIEVSFGRIGDSWKSRGDRRSKNGLRRLHGSLGRGRLRAFALGTRVRWRSRGLDTAQKMHELTIDGQRNQRNVFRWNSISLTDSSSGTIFSAFNDEQRSLGTLEADTSLPILRSHFAPILLNNPGLSISYDGGSLDPIQEVADDTTITVPVRTDTATNGELKLRIIEWRQGNHRAIYYGTDDLHFVHEEVGSDVESQFPFSAYVVWPDLDEQAGYLSLGGLAPEPISNVWRTAREAIGYHFDTRRRHRRREHVEYWKSTGVYPYKDVPTSEVEKAERAVFDVVSGALSTHIPKRNKISTRLTLTLLRDAIRHDPEKLTTVLHEVTALDSEDLDTFTRLLGETTLPAIIKSANIITSRNKFLLALNHLLFDPDDSPIIGERDHLHHILERELWIFGEGYNMMNSEKGLTQVLRTHLKLSGLPESDAKTVRRWNGKTGRVDLHLATQKQEHDRIRHLIVELKAPDITIGRTELNQVEDYANALISNPQFASSTAQWDLILVGTQLDDLATNRIDNDGAELGKFWGPKQLQGGPRVTAYVRRWPDVLDENKRRLDFLTRVLQHNPSTAEGLGWVRENYGDAFPKEMRGEDSQGEPGSEEEPGAV
ncbi:MAG: ATP-binding protein [Pseudonocardia sp.]